MVDSLEMKGGLIVSRAEKSVREFTLVNGATDLQKMAAGYVAGKISELEDSMPCAFKDYGSLDFNLEGEGVVGYYAPEFQAGGMPSILTAFLNKAKREVATTCQVPVSIVVMEVKTIPDSG